MTAKEQAIGDLKWANEKYPNATFGQQIKVAIAKYIMDECGATGEERQNACNRFMEAPAWFGASANAMTESGVCQPTKKGEKVVGVFEV